MKLLFHSIILLTCCTTLSAQVNFEPETIDDIEIGYGIAIGDVDGDGRDDIILADKKAFVWYRNPDWTRFTILENLTDRDNVCLAARDINGDGKVEMAVGAQWNPGETKDDQLSGSVHFLQRSPDPSQPWTALQLPHEPTVHRMQWVHTIDGYQLVVVPLHGRGNVQGQGRGVQIYAYLPPDEVRDGWKRILIDSSMHVTHNFDLIPDGNFEALLIGGKEGCRIFRYRNHHWQSSDDTEYQTALYDGFGEIRIGEQFMAGIQPFHGNLLTIYRLNGKHQIVTDELKQGHALACADLLGQGKEQIIVGWREKNEDGEMGIKIFSAENADFNAWTGIWVDKNNMACEDLKVSDLNGDGKPEIIAAGRSTKNLVIYWNRN
ncbi:MAG: FG-GAP repeat protein [Saprospiraceae bacterium]|nr:FG-GAP repeat protein [Saprospiraceae bacterium]